MNCVLAVVFVSLGFWQNRFATVGFCFLISAITIISNKYALIPLKPIRLWSNDFKEFFQYYLKDLRVYKIVTAILSVVFFCAGILLAVFEMLT